MDRPVIDNQLLAGHDIAFSARNPSARKGQFRKLQHVRGLVDRGGHGLHVTRAEIVDDDLVESLPKVQAGQLGMQLLEEVLHEVCGVEHQGLNHTLVHAAGIAESGKDRVREALSAIRLGTPVEFLGQLRVLLDLRVIRVLNGFETRCRRENRLDDGAAGHLAVPVVNSSRVALDVVELVTV